jgi:hypothetical protein
MTSRASVRRKAQRPTQIPSAAKRGEMDAWSPVGAQPPKISFGLGSVDSYAGEPIQRAVPEARAQSRHDELPPKLRQGMEALSGVSLADVRVKRSSSAPGKFGAEAFARGSEIHLAPNQDRHLAHEAWHVVQQKLGRVRPNSQIAGVPINDDPALEKEADLMGGRALTTSAPLQRRPFGQAVSTGEILQPMMQDSDEEDSDSDEEEGKSQGSEQASNHLANIENQIRYWAKRAAKKDSSGHGKGKKIKKGNSKDKHEGGQTRKVTHKAAKAGSLAEALQDYKDAGGTLKDLMQSTKKLLNKAKEKQGKAAEVWKNILT